MIGGEAFFAFDSSPPPVRFLADTQYPTRLWPKTNIYRGSKRLGPIIKPFAIIYAAPAAKHLRNRQVGIAVDPF